MFILQNLGRWIDMLAFSPDGKTLVSACRESAWLRFWDIEKRQQRAALINDSANIQCLAFAPDSATLAAVQGHRVRLWDVRDLYPVHAFNLGSPCSASSLLYSPDGATLTGGFAESATHWFGTTRCLEARQWDLGTRKERLQARIQIGSPVESMALAPGNTPLLVCTIAASHLDLWDLKKPPRRISLSIGGQITALAYAPDGQTLAIRQSSVVHLWDTAACEVRASLEGHRGKINTVAFTPDSRTLVTGSDDETVRLWDVTTGRERAAFRWEIGPVQAVAVAPDGMLAAAAGSCTRQIVVWDVDAG